MIIMTSCQKVLGHNNRFALLDIKYNIKIYIQYIHRIYASCNAYPICVILLNTHSVPELLAPWASLFLHLTTKQLFKSGKENSFLAAKHCILDVFSSSSIGDSVLLCWQMEVAQSTKCKCANRFSYFQSEVKLINQTFFPTSKPKRKCNINSSKI